MVGTISTAIWLPFRVSKSFSVCVSEAMSPLRQRPGLIDHAPRQRRHRDLGAAPRNAQPTSSASRTALAAFIAVRSLVRYAAISLARAGVGLKSTFGAVEISFSFSTEKFGFSL